MEWRRIKYMALITSVTANIPINPVFSGNPDSVKIVFWNVENFFDPFNDPDTADDEFTPSGERHWTWKKFLSKRNAIAKTIIAAGNGNMPVIVALAEIENRFVLEHLTGQTPLARTGYGIVHRDSPDGRGIDVALLYKKDRFKILKTNYFRVDFKNREETTRLILYVKGVLDLLDTLHLFVNHWPSKLGGEMRSLPKREAAAKKLKMASDSVLKTNQKANIIIAGDFNDTPDSPVLKLFENFHNMTGNLFANGEGSIKFAGKWELIDQIFISHNLLDVNEPVYCKKRGISIFRQPFNMEKDLEFVGEKPKRIYKGPIYNGGISDHLPLILLLYK